ncbi:MAG: prepilin-type N-terminal cleavage/methylation domain-containing protein [Capsulimonadales bacterium]|nr:prepilin-type N-terminal cleavage/methylation domain-containing protein [Capsulimonadales bacterium]
MSNNTRRAFTLVEIMIVVLVIGILLAIAVPNFVKARETSRANACITNLKQINSAKQQWAMDNKKNGSDSPVMTDLVGVTATAGYLQSTPTCPSSGSYTIGNIDTLPTCSITAPIAHKIP